MPSALCFSIALGLVVSPEAGKPLTSDLKQAEGPVPYAPRSLPSNSRNDSERRMSIFHGRYIVIEAPCSELQGIFEM